MLRSLFFSRHAKSLSFARGFFSLPAIFPNLSSLVPGMSLLPDSSLGLLPPFPSPLRGVTQWHCRALIYPIRMKLTCLKRLIKTEDLHFRENFHYAWKMIGSFWPLRVTIPSNKNARSPQRETGNWPSDLNNVCPVAKSSLIRTAQTDHEIQADAQDSQD